MNDFVTINGKKYRKGYTTGSCAAGAAKAAVRMLVTGVSLDTVEIDTPAGVRLCLALVDVQLSADQAKCAVVKDGGDDPDVTTGLKVFAQARYTDQEGIRVMAAEGIGMVTLPGLKVQPGNPAINPVPMQMLLKEAGEELPEGKGVEITLSVPGGEEAAIKTYNPKLGILGGISILGTSGIVVPMSEEAWKDSLALELDIKAADGMRQGVFVFGNYGEDFAVEKLGIDSRYIIKISNFAGFMLEQATAKGFEALLLLGHAGKLVKVAAGIFHTHSHVADARMETLTAYAALEGAALETLQRIYACRTTEAAVDILDEAGLTGVYQRIVQNASQRCKEHAFNKLRIGALLFDDRGRILAMDDTARQLLNAFKSSE